MFRCAEAVVHHVAPTRGAAVVRDIMGDHRPDVWLSDRYAAQQGHGKAHQTCLAHLSRDVAYALDGRDAALALGLKLWLGSAFALAEAVTTLAASTLATKRRALERRLDDLLARVTACDLTRAVQDKIRRARDQLLTFTLFPGQVEPTNNACERDLRPAIIQRKVTNGYRSTGQPRARLRSAPWCRPNGSTTDRAPSPRSSRPSRPDAHSDLQCQSAARPPRRMTMPVRTLWVITAPAPSRPSRPGHSVRHYQSRRPKKLSRARPRPFVAQIRLRRVSTIC